MKNFLTELERAELKLRHRKEKDRRTADRIKAVLLSNNGWSYRDIAEALLLDEDTISKHVEEYQREKKLSIVTGGSESKLSLEQSSELIEHLESLTYLKSSEICIHIKEKYGIDYTVAGMTNWLKNHGFSFIKPRSIPAKADPVKQESFIEEYQKLKDETPTNEPILFLDAVHPTMSTKITYGWIRKGSGKSIKTTASRTRMNIIGTIELANMKVHKKDYKTVNSESMIDFFDSIKKEYPDNNKIHIILDNGPYNASQKTKEAAKKRGIELHFLPAYSPNLNPIERLWKIMNEYTRNNRFFKTAIEFRNCINSFFDKTWRDISESMKNRITDNFQIIIKPSFSN
jgi:transposase